MARYFDIHPASPQRRAIVQIADIVRAGGVIAYPTDSCYALGCQLGNRDGIMRIRSIRHLDDRHHLTLVCQDFAQLGQFVHVDNAVFRAVKAATPEQSARWVLFHLIQETARHAGHADIIREALDGKRAPQLLSAYEAG